MSSAVAFLAVLALAGNVFAAPVAYDDGKYHPGTQYDDGTWDDEATPVASVVVPKPTSVSKITSVTKITSIASTTTQIKTSPKPTTTGPPAISNIDPTTIVVKTSTAKATTPPPTTTSPPSTGGGGTTAPSGSKQHYTGDGSTWPKVEQWLSFDTLWNLNKDGLGKGCISGKQNTPTEIQDIHDGIVSESKSTGVDSRFILAVIVQESHGCVRVGATSNGVTNPGIMQDHNGPNDCAHVGDNACPKEKIFGMIHDGTAGTKDGSGLKQGIESAAGQGATPSQQVYWSARRYNSGDNSYTPGGDLSFAAGATADYTSDVANRLMGYVF